MNEISASEPSENLEAPAVRCGELVRLLRPKTRGELRDALNAGQACEVPDCGVEMTSAMLRGWLNCENFTVKKSTNDDWVIFEPNDRDVGRAGSAPTPKP